MTTSSAIVLVGCLLGAVSLLSVALPRRPWQVASHWERQLAVLLALDRLDVSTPRRPWLVAVRPGPAGQLAVSGRGAAGEEVVAFVEVAPIGGDRRLRIAYAGSPEHSLQALARITGDAQVLLLCLDGEDALLQGPGGCFVGRSLGEAVPVGLDRLHLPRPR